MDCLQKKHLKNTDYPFTFNSLQPPWFDLYARLLYNGLHNREQARDIGTRKSENNIS